MYLGRKSSSSASPSKLYVNSAGLSVSGVRLDVHSRAPRRCRKQRIEIVSRPDTPTPAPPSVVFETATVRLKECRPRFDQLLSDEVKKIRETVRVEDLERLLAGLTGRQRHGRHPPATLTDPGLVYHHFFGVYYDLLRKVVAERMASVT